MLSTLLPLCAGVVFTANNNPRALSPATLASLAGQVGAPAVARVEADPHRAVALARRLAGELGAQAGRSNGGRRARHGLDLSRRRPRAPRRAPAGGSTL